MIPQETKTKIFALYYKSQANAVIIKGSYTRETGDTTPITANVIEDVRLAKILKFKYAIQTKKLSAISDEDAMAIGKMLEYKKDEQLLVGRSVAIGFENNFVEKGCNVLEIADFLRSSGYGLPAYGYSVDELVKEGIFKLDNL